MAHMTISELLKAAKRLEELLNNEEHWNELAEEQNRDYLLCTRALGREKFEHFMKDDSLSRQWDKAVGLLDTVAQLLLDIKMMVAEANRTNNIEALMYAHSVCAKQYYATEKLLNFMRSQRMPRPLDYEEYIAQLTDDTPSLRISKTAIDEDTIKKLVGKRRQLKQKMLKLDSEITALNHSCLIEVPEAQAKLMQELNIQAF